MSLLGFGTGSYPEKSGCTAHHWNDGRAIGKWKVEYTLRGGFSVHRQSRHGCEHEGCRETKETWEELGEYWHEGHPDVLDGKISENVAESREDALRQALEDNE